MHSHKTTLTMAMAIQVVFVMVHFGIVVLLSAALPGTHIIP